MKPGRVQKTFITTADTHETYVFPKHARQEEDAEPPCLWEATLSLAYVKAYGDVSPKRTEATIYVTEKTLRKAGLRQEHSEAAEPVEVTETMEDLAIRLLEHLGVYPSEE